MTVENALQGTVLYTEDKNKDFEVAIYFDCIQDETSTAEASITDNWVESNYSIQDHIAVKPRIYRLRGCVGEVVYEDVSRFVEALSDLTANHPVLQKTVNALQPISALSGVVSNYTQAAINVVKQIESSYDRYKQIWKNFTKRNQYAGKRQKYVYAILNQMLQNRIPVKLTGLMFDFNPFVEGQYEKLYYIQSVSAHQGENAFISDIEVTIKEFRIASTSTTQVDKSKYAGIKASQSTSEAQNGLSKNQKVNTEKPLKAVQDAWGKADKIISDPNKTIGGQIKTFTLKMLEETKIWVKNF